MVLTYGHRSSERSERTAALVAPARQDAAAAVSIGMAPSEMADGFNKAMPVLAAYGK